MGLLWALHMSQWRWNAKQSTLDILLLKCSSLPHIPSSNTNYFTPLPLVALHPSVLPYHFTTACFSLAQCWPCITFIYSSLLANHTLLTFGFLKPKSMPNTQEDLNKFTWIARHNIYQSLKKKSRQSDQYMATSFGFKASLGIRNFCQAKLWCVVVKLLLR